MVQHRLLLKPSNKHTLATRNLPLPALRRVNTPRPGPTRTWVLQTYRDTSRYIFSRQRVYVWSFVLWSLEDGYDVGFGQINRVLMVFWVRFDSTPGCTCFRPELKCEGVSC